MRAAHLLAAVAAVTASLALTANAQADSYCVAPATGCDNSPTSFPDAVTAAQSHPGADTIRLGAATYPGVSIAGTDALTIEGAGRGQTTIASTTLGVNQAVVDRLNGSTLTLRDLAVSVGTAGDPSGPRAVSSPSSGGSVTLQRVDIKQSEALNDPTGVSLSTDMNLDDVSINLSAGGDCMYIGAGTNTITRLSTQDCGGINMQGGTTTISRSRIANAGIAILAGAGAQATIHSSVLLPATNGYGLYANSFAANNTSLVARHVTIVQPNGFGVYNAIAAGTTATSTINVYDSILRGATTDFALSETIAGTTVTTTVARTNAGTTIGPDVSITGTPTFAPTAMVDVDPQFSDTVNYHLAAGSPMVDADATALAMGEPNLDYDGNLRVVNGKRDLGAHERPLTPTAAATATSVTATSAFIDGNVSTGGGVSLVKLEYGPTIAYGQTIDLPAPPPSADAMPIGQALLGLAPGTTYHARLVITNFAGTVTSPDIPFRTTGGAAGPDLPPAPVPVLSKLAFSPKKPTAGKAVSVSFTASAAGRATLKVTKSVKGRKKGKSCSTTAKKGKRCTKTVSVYSKSATLKAGTNKISIPKAKVRQGTFKVTVTPAGGKAISKTLKVGKKAKKRK